MQLSYNSKFKPKVSLFTRLQKTQQKLALLVVAAIVTIFLIVKTTGTSSSSKYHSYPKEHGYYKEDVVTKSPLIFPPIEHAPLLRELTIDGLFNHQTDAKGNKKYLITEAFSDEDTKLNNKLPSEDAQMLKVKNNFLNHGRIVSTSSPEIVIVTAVDYEKYELSHLTKIVQNRVNYAQKKGYGVYVRWMQEFLPFINEPNYKEWARLYLLRQAMYAFPNAKYFWYLDQDALVMRYDIDLNKYLLEPRVLDPIMLRDQPIVPPNGVVHTYKNSKASNVDIIVTQLSQDLNLNSFIIKNSFMSKALLEFWNDSLFKSYHNFPKFTESALTHILQWHPIFLSRTAIIPPRTINGLHTAIQLPPEGDDLHYSKGDFVVSLRDCHTRKSCEKEIDMYWEIVEGGK